MGSCKVWNCTTQGHCRNVNKNTFSENVKIMVLKWLMFQDQSKCLFVIRLRVTQEAGFRESRLGKTFIYSPRSLDMKSKFSKNWHAAWLQEMYLYHIIFTPCSATSSRVDKTYLGFANLCSASPRCSLSPKLFFVTQILTVSYQSSHWHANKHWPSCFWHVWGVSRGLKA